MLRRTSRKQILKQCKTGRLELLGPAQDEYSKMIRSPIFRETRLSAPQTKVNLDIVDDVPAISAFCHATERLC